MAKRSDLARALVVTAEVCGYELSRAAAEAMATDLAAYPDAAVLAALNRCRSELSGRLTLAAILGRIEDGHPGPEEAWAMCPKDEAVTAVWTRPMCQAFGVARALFAEGDSIAARMAFRETYSELVRSARSRREGATWTVSLGHDRNGRDSVIRDAVATGKIAPDHAALMLGPGDANALLRLRDLAEQAFPRRLT